MLQTQVEPDQDYANPAPPTNVVSGRIATLCDMVSSLVDAGQLQPGQRADYLTHGHLRFNVARNTARGATLTSCTVHVHATGLLVYRDGWVEAGPWQEHCVPALRAAYRRASYRAAQARFCHAHEAERRRVAALHGHALLVHRSAALFD